MTTLGEQVAVAQASVRRMKKHTPYLFPAWQRVQTAKAEVKRAQLELKAARQAWKEF